MTAAVITLWQHPLGRARWARNTQQLRDRTMRDPAAFRRGLDWINTESREYLKRSDDLYARSVALRNRNRDILPQTFGEPHAPIL